MQNELKPFTVVLIRPDYLAEPNYGEDFYTSIVDATDAQDAVDVAQTEAYKRDLLNLLTPDFPEDYGLVVVFEGHHQPTLYGDEL